MMRVTFGNTSPPFLSIASVQKHAEDNKEIYPLASKEILENMYVEDLLSGTDCDQSALQLKHDMSKLMETGGFNLTKWASNSSAVMENIPLEEQAPNFIITSNNDGFRKDVRFHESIWNFMEYEEKRFSFSKLVQLL